MEQALMEHFAQKANPEKALKMSAYLRDQFYIIGLSTPERKAVQKAVFADVTFTIWDEVAETIQRLYNRKERECHYAAIDLAVKYRRMWDITSGKLFNQMVICHSWWDTVDAIATKLCGPFVQHFVDEAYPMFNKWVHSSNMWENRVAIIYQLHFKDKTHLPRLVYAIRRFSGSQEFFLQKAIGWALRQYAKTDFEWVRNFVDNQDLAPLSRREALKHLQRQ